VSLRFETTEQDLRGRFSEVGVVEFVGDVNPGGNRNHHHGSNEASGDHSVVEEIPEHSFILVVAEIVEVVSNLISVIVLEEVDQEVLDLNQSPGGRVGREGEGKAVVHLAEHAGCIAAGSELLRQEAGQINRSRDESNGGCEVHEHPSGDHKSIEVANKRDASVVDERAKRVRVLCVRRALNLFHCFRTNPHSRVCADEISEQHAEHGRSELVQAGKVLTLA